MGQGWTTRVEYDAAEKTFQSAKAAVDAASAVLHTAEDQLGYTQLLADAAGVVTATGAEPGEVVRAGQMIVTVAQHNGVDAVFDVPDSLMRRLRPDVTVTVALTDDPQDPDNRAGSGSVTAGRPGDPKLPGQDRSGSTARRHAVGRDGVRAGAHGARKAASNFRPPR